MSGTALCFRARAVRAWHRRLSYSLARRRLYKSERTPLISFSFDDFPRSAGLNGAGLLEEHGVRGTYYVSLGLVGRDSPVGRIATHEDLHHLSVNGHELGCHTFGHLNGWSSSAEELESSVLENRRAFEKLFPSKRLRVFAYPLNSPRYRTKAAIGRHFLCCRGGGQTYNRRRLDLNLLRACFLDWRNRDEPGQVKELIDQSNAAGGWLIFATHDVAAEPSQYGCSPRFFGEVVKYAVASGARVLPVEAACLELGADRPS